MTAAGAAGPAIPRGVLPKILASLERVVLVVWVGSLWTLGLMVAPALFAVLPDPALAGDVAGHLFTLEARLSLICGLLLLGLWASARPRQPHRGGVIVMMLLMVVAGEWLIRPLLESARGGPGADSAAFAFWHGAAALSYLAVSLLGLWLAIARPAR